SSAVAPALAAPARSRDRERQPVANQDHRPALGWGMALTRRPRRAQLHQSPAAALPLHGAPSSPVRAAWACAQLPAPVRRRRPPTGVETEAPEGVRNEPSQPSTVVSFW